jgi:hypothetical protein
MTEFCEPDEIRTGYVPNINQKLCRIRQVPLCVCVSDGNRFFFDFLAWNVG